MTLSTEQIANFEKALRAEKQRLEGELATVGRKNPSNPNDWEPVPEKMDVMRADPNEAADAVEEYEENTAILRELEVQLVEVDAALKRIEEGTYGLCQTDKEPIDIKRLEANPSARTCVAHANNKR